METKFRTRTADGRPCCATNDARYLCARCRPQGQARTTTATARPATPAPPAPQTPTAAPAASTITRADAFRFALATWRVRMAGGAR